MLEGQRSSRYRFGSRMSHRPAQPRTQKHRLVQEPGNRRFTRYRRRLAARCEGASQPFFATELGRGGLFITTPDILESNSAMRCNIELPETGRTVAFEGKVRFRAESQRVPQTGYRTAILRHVVCSRSDVDRVPGEHRVPTLSSRVPSHAPTRAKTQTSSACA